MWWAQSLPCGCWESRVLVWARHLASLEISAHALSDTFQSILRFSRGFLLQTGFQAQSCAAQNSTETGRERLGLCQLSVPGSVTTGCMVRSLLLLLRRSFRWPLFPTCPILLLGEGSPFFLPHSRFLAVCSLLVNVAALRVEWTYCQHCQSFILAALRVEWDLLPALPVLCTGSICQSWCFLLPSSLHIPSLHLWPASWLGYYFKTWV